MKPCSPTTNDNGVSNNDANKEARAFTKGLETAIQRLSNGLSSSNGGALIQVWMPELCSGGRVLLSTEGLPFSISGVGDLLALFRCISCKYRFDADPRYGDSMGAIGRVFFYGQPELCLDVQHYDKNAYLRVTEAQRCRIHSTLILPIFSGASLPASAVVELSHHDKTVEFANIIQLFVDALSEVGLRTADVALDNWKLGLRKWPVEVCSVPNSSSEEARFTRKHPDEQGISSDHTLGRAMQTGQPDLRTAIVKHLWSAGFGRVSDFLMNIGMESLTCEEHSTNDQLREPYNATHLRSNPLKNDLVLDVSHGVPIEQAKSISDTGSANTTNFPEQHSNDTSVTPNEAIRVCQASQPIAQEADQDMHSDSPEDTPKLKSEDEKDDDNIDDDDNSSEAKKKENRLGGGAGKRLTYRELEAHFGHGLKDAARRLGICPTTLKRACRRNGISRWPSRQISKLLKVWKQMGYKGEPPSWLLQNAISGNLRSENLAYVLSAGLHVGLKPQRCECASKTPNLKTKHGHLSLYCSSSHGSDPDGALMMEDDIALKNLTHHGAFTAALHGTDDDGFTFQEEQGDGHDNQTWHAGQMANVVLHPSSFMCHSQAAPAIPVQPLHFSREIAPCKQGGPTAYDLERTQRGGTGLIPVMSEFATSVETDDVLMQSYHLPLGFESAHQNLFH